MVWSGLLFIVAIILVIAALIIGGGVLLWHSWWITGAVLVILGVIFALLFGLFLMTANIQ